MKPIYIKREDVRFINPYTFIPISKGQHVKRSELEAGADELHTGILHCRLYVRTPLGIPDVDMEKEASNGHREYPFFSYKEGGKKIPVIPGSSLRGTIRSVFEAATDSCFVTLREDTGLSRRIDNREPYRPGILKWEEGAWHLYQADRYLLPVTADRNGRAANIIKKGENGARIIETPKEKALRFGDPVVFRSYKKGNRGNEVADDVRKREEGVKYPGGSKFGLLYVGEPFPKKKNESIFVAKGEERQLAGEQLKKAYDGLLESLAIYRNPAINRDDKHSRYADFEHARKESGIPVWYSAADKKLSLAAIGRTFYNKSLNELVGERNPCKNRKKVCEACALFGMTGDESLGSRVRFMDARAQEGYVLRKETLKILGQPRYSYLPFYARAGFGLPRSYDEDNVEIAGRKLYWHNRNAASDSSIYTAKEKNQMNSTMELVEPGAEFAFDIYYDGVSREQLQKLMWCIHLGENKKDGNMCHKLGHGKPLGLGSVKIVIEKKEERLFAGGAYRWAREEMPGEETRPAFQRWKELTEVMDFRKPAGAPVMYPYICDESGKDLSSESRNNEDARHVWFQQNKRNRKDTEGLPGIMSKSQVLHAYQKVQNGSQNNVQKNRTNWRR